MKPSEFLKKNGWCKGEVARDAEGKETSILDDKAVSFCLNSVVYMAYRYQEEQRKEAYRKVDEVVLNVCHWNDHICKSKDQAIKMLESIGE